MDRGSGGLTGGGGGGSDGEVSPWSSPLLSISTIGFCLGPATCLLLAASPPAPKRLLPSSGADSCIASGSENPCR